MTAMNGVGAVPTVDPIIPNWNDGSYAEGLRAVALPITALAIAFFGGAAIPLRRREFKATDNFSKIVLTTIIGTVALASLKSLVLAYPVLAVYIHVTIVVLATAAIIKLVKDM